MLRLALAFIIATVIVFLAKPYIHALIIYIDYLYNYMYLKTMTFVRPTPLITYVIKVLVMVLIPIIIVLILGLIHKIIFGKPMRYQMELAWILWFILALSIVLIH